VGAASRRAHTGRSDFARAKERTVRFEIVHDFDVPLDAVEAAALSPELGARLARRLTRIESVETLDHAREDGAVRRVLRFQASAPLSLFRGTTVARDAMAWQEHWSYRLSEHTATWAVLPKEQYRRYFRSEGTYRLEPCGPGRTRRTVVGELEIQIALMRGVAERMALSEVKKTYDAEADTLRELATS
jgi:hypothetical protein